METLPLAIDNLVKTSRRSRYEYFVRCCENEHLSVNTQLNRNATVVILKNIVNRPQRHHSLVSSKDTQSHD